MPTSDFDALPDRDDWLEHTDTVVLDRAQEAELDPPAPVEDRRADRNARGSSSGSAGG